MPEEFITTREFDGFTESIRGEIRSLSDSVIGVGGKLDALILKSNRSMLFLGSRKAPFNAPSVTESGYNRLLFYPDYFSPFRNTRRFIAHRQNNVIPSVPSLFDMGCPSAISGAVPTIVINSVNRMGW